MICGLWIWNLQPTSKKIKSCNQNNIIEYDEIRVFLNQIIIKSDYYWIKLLSNRIVIESNYYWIGLLLNKIIMKKIRLLLGQIIIIQIIMTSCYY
jgi:hypothetical protein